MTAYISRLLHPANHAAGVRPRPRSRYEPDPGTSLDHGPIEIDHEWATEAEPGAGPRPREPRADYASTPAIGPATPHRLPTAPAEDAMPSTQRRQPNRQRPDGFPITNPVSADAPASLPDARFDIPAITPFSDTLSAGKNPDQPNAPSAVPVPTNPPSRPGEQTRPYPSPPRRDALAAIRQATARPPEQSTAAASFVASPEDPATRPAREVEPANRPRYPLPATPSQALRQQIVDAIVEPVRADPTEIIVHIDRIDVRAASNTQPPSAAPRQARAAPMSLDSYLRAQSRRRPG